jgi:hypothetical protein
MNAILDVLASQQQRGETSLVVRIEPDLLQDAMNALRSYRKLFAPVLPGLTDTVPIYAVGCRPTRVSNLRPSSKVSGG